jgi:AhpC/TSA antioxidant enzyme
VGPGKPEHLPAFRRVTGYQGALFTDPSLRTYQAAGLTSGILSLLHPRSLLGYLRAFGAGFRPRGVKGNPAQQGGTFVLGPGERVRFEWRDRYSGDHPDPKAVLAALG